DGRGRTMKAWTRWPALALGGVLALVGAACGDDEDDAEDTAAAATAAAPAEEAATDDAGAAEDTGEAATGEAVEEGGEAAVEPMTLRIGFSGALEGAYAAYAATLLKGMEYAATKINGEGGPITVEIVSKN